MLNFAAEPSFSIARRSGRSTLRLFPAARVEIIVRLFWRIASVLLLLFELTPLRAQDSNPFTVEIDLQEQTAYLIQDGRVVLSTPIASGRYGHLTPTGSFKIIEKERNHYSSMYGKIVDARGNTIVADADADMPVPPGGRFVPAPMRYFMRFSGANGMHAGYLPGYPASHGCVRLPEENAIAFFNAIDVGTPVTVFGRTPRGRYSEESQWMPRRRSPFMDPRSATPWWWR
jgi:hypothetical protein